MANKSANTNILLESGTGEFEMLTFSVGKEIFGVNVSKVREIIWADCHVSRMPGSHEHVLGIFKPRDEIITALDLRHCLYNTHNDAVEKLYAPELTAADKQLLKNKHFIVCGFNGIVQGWLVDEVHEIIRLPWTDIVPPTEISGDNSYITGIYVDKVRNIIVQIVDFEAIATQISPEAGLTVSDVDKISEEDAMEVQKAGLTAYIADDSRMLNKLISESLVKAGYKIVSHSDGQQLYNSLMQLKANKNIKACDIVITDVEMPVMDGMQLCKLIKEDEQLQRLPVLIFSSLIDEPMKRKCESVHADGAFSKPQIGELIEHIQIAIKHAKEVYGEVK